MPLARLSSLGWSRRAFQVTKEMDTQTTGLPLSGAGGEELIGVHGNSAGAHPCVGTELSTCPSSAEKTRSRILFLFLKWL